MTDTGKTLSLRIEKELRDRISSNEWKVDSTIPSEIELCTEYGVSRTTMRRAIQRLVDDGLLIRVRGRGTMVTQKGIISRIPYSGLRTKIWEMMDNTTPAKVSFEMSIASNTVARRLNIAEGDQIVKIERLYHDAESNNPHTLAYTYLTPHNAESISINMLYTTSVGMLLQDKGLVSGNTYELLRVSTINEYESKMMGLAVGMPALIFEETRMDNNKVPFYYSKYVMRGDKVRIAFTVENN